MTIVDNTLKIIFMGTPVFSVPSLKAIYEKYGVEAVVTVPDKPKGRGRKLQGSPVKEFAIENGIAILQPDKLSDESFIAEIKEINPDIICVIAFRILPEEVYSLANIAAFNIHGSLLPKYRGAAPINWAVINGEKETGLTSFVLQKKVDTGDILLKERIDIEEDMTAGELHDKLMGIASGLSINTIELLRSADYKTYSQNDEQASPAPKIFKDDCLIDWKNDSERVKNFIHGLSPYPAAWTIWNGKTVKVLRAKNTDRKLGSTGAYLISDGELFVMCGDGCLEIVEIKPEGKRNMLVSEYLKGYRGEMSGELG